MNTLPIKDASEQPTTILANSNETDIPFSGPAIFTNRFFVALGASGIRIAFTEQYDLAKPPIFRTAVVMPVQDAIQLYKVLRDILKEPEAAIEKAIAEVTTSPQNG